MIKEIIEREEGFRVKPYLCSEGYVTIGYGTKLHKEKGMNPEDFTLTVSRGAAYALLDDKVKLIKSQISFGPYNKIFDNLSTARKQILISMAYQMGVSGLYGFKKMWAALDVGDWPEAAYQMMDSKWAKQTPNRARRHADSLQWDTLEEYL